MTNRITVYQAWIEEGEAKADVKEIFRVLGKLEKKKNR